MRKIPILYIYDEVVGTFKIMDDLYLERVIIHEDTPKEQVLYMATNSIKKVHYRVWNHPNRAYYNYYTLVYTIWMNSPDESLAKKLILELVKRVNKERITYHDKKSMIHRNNIEQANTTLICV